MEIGVDLDEETVEELREEARLQGFDGLSAYLRWIVAHRPMSDLASSQAPAVASRVSELEARTKLIERQLGLDEPVDPDADLGDGGAGGSAESLDGSGSFESEFETRDGGDESEVGLESEADAAGDDDIADAVGDVSLDDDRD